MDTNVPSWKQRYENTKDIACSFRNQVHLRDDTIRQVTQGWQAARSQLDEAHGRIAELEALRQWEQQRQREELHLQQEQDMQQQHKDGSDRWLHEVNTPAGAAGRLGGPSCMM